MHLAHSLTCRSPEPRADEVRSQPALMLTLYGVLLAARLAMVVWTDLGVERGKIAAQVAHAASPPRSPAPAELTLLPGSGTGSPRWY